MNRLSKYRQSAFISQSGRCYYCGCRMWLGDSLPFRQAYLLTAKQAKAFECTAEHLLAKQDGGTEQRSNIVAACRKCNYLRHARKNPKDIEGYKLYVKKRMNIRKWHFPYAFSSGVIEESEISVNQVST